MKFRPPQALTVSPLQQGDWPSPHLVAICRPPIPAFPPCRQPNQLGASRPTSASTRKTCCRPTLLFLSMSASTLAPSLNGRPRCSHHVVHIGHARRFLHVLTCINILDSRDQPGIVCAWPAVMILSVRLPRRQLKRSALLFLSQRSPQMPVNQPTLFWNPSHGMHMLPWS